MFPPPPPLFLPALPADPRIFLGSNRNNAIIFILIYFVHTFYTSSPNILTPCALSRPFSCISDYKKLPMILGRRWHFPLYIYIFLVIFSHVLNLSTGSVARDSSIIPIHGSLHILVDLVTRGCGGKSTNRVKNPRVGWANSMERGDVGLLRGMK